jgi:hypothetical protein
MLPWTKFVRSYLPLVRKATSGFPSTSYTRSLQIDKESHAKYAKRKKRNTEDEKGLKYE